MGLIRWSPATVHRVADSCSSARRVRNFSSVKGRPYRPTRSCRKITPGPSEIRTASAHAPITGEAAISATAASRPSTARFTQRSTGRDGRGSSGCTACPHSWSAGCATRMPVTLAVPAGSASQSRQPWSWKSRTSEAVRSSASGGRVNTACRTEFWMTARRMSSWVASTGTLPLPSSAAPVSASPTGRSPYSGRPCRAAATALAPAPGPTTRAEAGCRRAERRRSRLANPRPVQVRRSCRQTAPSRADQPRACPGAAAATTAAAPHHRTAARAASAGSSSSAEGASRGRYSPACACSAVASTAIGAAASAGSAAPGRARAVVVSTAASASAVSSGSAPSRRRTRWGRARGRAWSALGRRGGWMAVTDRRTAAVPAVPPAGPVPPCPVCRAGALSIVIG